jgi:hypothetical protein
MGSWAAESFAIDLLLSCAISMTGILVPCVMDLQSTEAADALGF